MIASLRDEACTQWASGWLAFQRRVSNAYPGLDLNFDIPNDEEVEESFSANCSGKPAAPAKVRSLLHLLLTTPRLMSEPPCFLSTLGFEPGIYVMSFLALVLNEYPIFYLLALPLIVFLVLLCLS